MFMAQQVVVPVVVETYAVGAQKDGCGWAVQNDSQSDRLA